jgi:hypothetical protein
MNSAIAMESHTDWSPSIRHGTRPLGETERRRALNPMPSTAITFSSNAKEEAKEVLHLQPL